MIDTSIPLAVRVDGDGCHRMKAKAHAALTAKTPYYLSMDVSGHVTKAIADDALQHQIIVPEEDVASGAYFWGVVKGPVSGLITPSLSVTAGHALGITDGVVADLGAAYADLAAQFAICTTTSTTSTTQDVILDGKRFTAAT